MQVATLLKNKLTKKQTIIIGSVIGAVAIISTVVFGYFFLQKQVVKTKASSDGPQNVVSSVQGPTSAKISWSTESETVPVIEYGTSLSPSSFTSLPASSTPKTDHTIDLSALKPGKTYYFQIKIGENVYNNNGVYWTFTVPAAGDNLVGVVGATGTTPSISPGSTSPTIAGTSPSTTLTPRASITVTVTPTITPTIDPNATPTPSASAVCSSTNCSTIQKNLGTVCSTQDYIRCIYNLTLTVTGTVTPTRTPTPTITTAPTTVVAPANLKTLCKPTYLQANSCSSFTWSAMSDIDQQCSTTFTRYFLQCKSSSFESTDASVWYCNQALTASTQAIPCQGAPTPAPGQSVFCRVRAETASGGADNSTDWVNANTSCSAYSSTNIGSCSISYIQGNTCKSWIWDLVNSKDPTCSKSFSRYFLQCTSNGDFTGATGTWHCNTTVTNHYLDLPCYNAVTPADGTSITCRVRAEDGYGTDAHSTAWVSSSSVCPTSTPTPTFTPSPTPTLTPTTAP